MFSRPGWLLLALLLPLIVLLYFKRKQVLEYRVSCLEFWEEAVREKEGIRVTRIERYLPLALQLMIGALLVAAAAGPVRTQALAGERVTLALDGSISMRALEDDATRFSTAKDEVRRIIQRLTPDTRVSVVLLKDGGEELIRDAPQRQALEAIRWAECTSEPLNAAAASRYLEAYPSPVVLVSDKDLGWGDRAVRVGGVLDNAGIVQASYDYYTGSVLFTAKNYARSDKVIVVSLWSGTWRVDTATVAVPAGDEGSGAFKVPKANGTLAVKIENDDMLDADNVFLVAAGDNGRKKVLLRADEFFLEKALSAAADVKLEVADGSGGKYEGYDVVVTGDGSEIADLPPGTGVWLLLPEGAVTEGEDGVKGVPLEPAGSSLTEGLHLKNAYAKNPGRLEEREGFQTVLGAGGGPVMMCGVENGRKVVYSSIEFAETNLVMLPDFPVLVSNTVNWLDGGQAGRFAANPPPVLMVDEEGPGAPRRIAETRPICTGFGNVPLAAALFLLVAEWEVYRRGL